MDMVFLYFKTLLSTCWVGPALFFVIWLIQQFKGVYQVDDIPTKKKLFYLVILMLILPILKIFLW